ncbi:MAG: hypothetical protein H2212_12755 [Ruminococcus sp.]|nr:hypothetical protein [Ruminococcus sp.]
MNFGLNIYNWLVTNLQYLALAAILAVGIYFAVSHKFAKMFGMLAVLIIAIGFVFNPGGVKDLLLELFNTVFGV